MKSFDFVNDASLSAALPLALRQRMVAIQQARIDAGFTSKNGMTYKSAERRDKADAAFDRATA